MYDVMIIYKSSHYSIDNKNVSPNHKVMQTRLYAVGGVNSVGRLSSVECYCVEEDR